MSVKATLLAALSLITTSHLFSQPTDAEISAALDDESGLPWIITSGGDYTLEVVDDPEAVGGTALKISATNGGSILIQQSLEGRGYVSYSYKVETTDLNVFQAYNRTIYLESLPIEEVATNTWIPEQYNHTQEDLFGWRVESPNAETTHTVYIDNYSYTEGYPIEVTGFGMNTEISPVQATYKPGDPYILTATPINEDHEFLYWASNNSRILSTSSIRNEIIGEGSSSYSWKAVGGKRFSYGNVEVIVPANLLVSDELDDDGLPVLNIEAPIGNERWIKIETTGPGFLNFWATGDGSVNDDGISAPEGETEQRSIGLSPDPIRYEMPVRGTVSLGSFNTVNGFPVEVTTRGMGSVIGIPESNFSQLGDKYTLTAIPEEGWVFCFWEGVSKIETNPLEVETYGNQQIEAVFARRQEFLGWETKVLGDFDWTEEEAGDSSWIMSPPLIGIDTTSTLVWEVDGPGQFYFEYQSDEDFQTLLLNGEDLELMDATHSNPPNQVALELPPGHHTLEIFLDNREYSQRSIELLIQNLGFTPGIPVTLLPIIGGTVTGIDEGTTRVDVGTVLNLTATPDEGLSFESWAGSIAGTETTFEVEVYSPTEVGALFKKEVTDDPWVTQLSGERFWNLVDGVWHTPEIMGKGEKALLTGTISGPASLELQLDTLVGDGDGFLKVWLNGVHETGGNTNRSYALAIPEGEHAITLEFAPDDNGQYDQHKLVMFDFFNNVNIQMEFGTFSATPNIDYNYDLRAWTGTFKRGTEISFTTSGGDGPTFLGWTGDLAGLEANDSFIVDGPVAAIGSYQTSTFVVGEQEWTVTPTGTTFIPENGVLSLIAEDDEPIIKTTLEGPGFLWVQGRNLLEVEAKIDGEVLPEHESSSFTNFRYIIPEGEHEVELLLRADPNQFFVSIFEPERMRAGISNMEFSSGHPLFLSVSGRGSIAVDPSGFTVPSGTSVTFTAEPREGNVFTGWSEPFQEHSVSFSQEINEVTNVRANFVAATDAGGYTWEFEGTSSYLTPTSRYPNGYLIFPITPGDTVETLTARLSIDGPGVLQFKWWTNWRDLEEINPRFTLGGETFTPGPENFFIPLGPGSNEVTFAVDIPLMNEDAFAGTLRLELPDFLTEFSVTATGQNAEVTLEPDQATYAAGDAITLTAPATNDDGANFVGWWDLDTFQFDSDQSTWNTTVQGDARYEARYLAGHLVFDYLSVAQDTTSQWFEDAENPSPEGAASLVANDDAVIEFTALEDCFLNFSLKLAGTDPFIRVHTSMDQTYIWQNGPFDWTPFQIFLQTGEVLYIGFDAYSEDAAAVLGDLTVTQGWAPGIGGVRPHQLEFTPPLDGLTPGDMFSAKVIPELNSSFIGWRDEGPVVRSFEKTFEGEYGAYPLFFPYLMDLSPVPGLTIQDESLGWMPKLEEDDDFVYFWESRLMDDEKPFHELLFNVTGPGAVTFDQNLSIGETNDRDYLEIDLDGDPVVIQDRLTNEGGYYTIYIPTGEHSLSFRHVRNESHRDAEISQMWFHTGVITRGKVYSQGEVKVTPSGTFLSPGELVTIEAIPNPGWTFVDWEAPFQGQPRKFTHTAKDPVPFVPVWEEAIIPFSAAGLNWIAHGMSVSPLHYYRDDLNLLFQNINLKEAWDSNDTWIETEVEGPAILRWDTEPHPDWVLQTIDGFPIDGPEAMSRFAPEGWKTLAIPAGTHKVRGIEMGRRIELLPLIMVSVESLGFAFTEGASFGFYEPGSEFTLQVPEFIPMDLLEWRNLPPSAVIDGNQITFTAHDHVDLTAMLFSKENFFGFEVEHAGHVEWVPWHLWPDRIVLPRLPSRSTDHIRLSPPQPGLFEYYIDSSPYAHLEVQLNGETIPSLSGKNVSSTGFIAVQGPEDVITWTLEEAGSWEGGFASNNDDIAIKRLHLHEDIPATPYGQWINKFSSAGRLYNDLIQVDGDINRDGVNNYLSYLLDLSPFESTVLLGIIPDDGNLGDFRTLWHPTFPEDLVDSFIIEYTTHLKDGWVDAADILSDPYADPEFPDITLCDVLLSPGEVDGLFFRIRYTDHIPSINNLLY